MGAAATTHGVRRPLAFTGAALQHFSLKSGSVELAD